METIDLVKEPTVSRGKHDDIVPVGIFFSLVRNEGISECIMLLK